MITMCRIPLPCKQKRAQANKAQPSSRLAWARPVDAKFARGVKRQSPCLVEDEPGRQTQVTLDVAVLYLGTSDLLS